MLQVRVFTDGTFNTQLSEKSSGLQGWGYHGGADMPPSPQPLPTKGLVSVTTDSAFAKGVPIVITIGTRQTFDVSSLHVGVNASLQAKWFLNGLFVQDF